MNPTLAPRATRALAAVMLALASPAISAAAQATRIPVQAGVVLSRDSVTVGDVVQLTVRVRAPFGATVNFPTLTDSLAPVQSLEPPTVRNGADSLEAADRIAVYRLAPWDVGALPLRLGSVLVQTDDDERRVALSLPPLFVRSVLPADSALHIPKPARAILDPRTVTPWWWWLLAALAAVAIGIGAWYRARRRRREAGPTGDPFADAEREFERIDRLRLIEAGEPGRHAALAADVLRRYLAARASGATLAMTTGELLAALRGSATVPVDRVQALFAVVDRVKFAAAPIDAAEARDASREARAIVRQEHERQVALAAAVETTRERGMAA